MAALPAGLAPLAANYSSSDPGGVLRTEVAGGPARCRMDWGRGTQRYNITLVMSGAEFDAWITFYHLTVKKGALAFDMPLDSGFGVTPHSVYIVPGSYNAARQGGTVYTVSFVAEATSQAYAMSAAEGAGLVALYNTCLQDTDTLLARIAQFANVDSLALAYP